MKIFKRKVYDLLKRWKETSKGRTALFLDGARRVGKTTIVKEFAENEYEDYLLLDFTKETDDIKKLFSENMNDLDEFYRILFLNKGKVLPRHQSVIILDEIQFCPPARQAIKHLVADGRYDFIETGSLISVRRSSRKIMIPSEEHKERMYPMDFEEFLWAIGDDSTVSLIRDNYLERKSLGNIAHRAVMKKFRVYMVVGGMPQAVCDYVEGKSYQEIDFTKREIISLYEEDLLKYDDNYNIRASAVFHTIPEQLMNRNSHFKMSKIDKSARYREYVNSIRFIEESMMGNLCINVTAPMQPLELYAEHGNFKLYMSDTGLLITQLMKSDIWTGDDIYKALINDRISADLGMVFENIVAQMLTAAGGKLYYHEFMFQEENEKTEKKYEIDFLISKQKKVCPIEVKSSGYTIHKSFDMFVEKYSSNIKIQNKYILYNKDLQYKDGTVYLPVYMTMFLWE